MEPLLYTPDEAARLLAIPRTRVYQLMAEGTLTYVHLGRRRRISATSLEAFVSSLAPQTRD
jgi:excisionase family DNA binding protein